LSEINTEISDLNRVLLKKGENKLDLELNSTHKRKADQEK